MSMTRKLYKSDPSCQVKRPMHALALCILCLVLLDTLPPSGDRSGGKSNSMILVRQSTYMVNCLELDDEIIDSRPIRRSIRSISGLNYPKCLPSTGRPDRSLQQSQDNIHKYQSKRIDTQDGDAIETKTTEIREASPSQVIAVNLSKTIQDQNEKQVKQSPQIIVLPLPSSNEDTRDHEEVEVRDTTRVDDHSQGVGHFEKENLSFQDLDFPMEWNSDLDYYDADYYELDEPKLVNSSLNHPKKHNSSTKKPRIWDQLKRPLIDRLQAKLKQRPMGRHHMPKKEKPRRKRQISLTPSDQGLDIRKLIRPIATSLALTGRRLVNATLSRASDNIPARLANLNRFRGNLRSLIINDNPVLNSTSILLDTLRDIANSTSRTASKNSERIFLTSWGSLFNLFADAILSDLTASRLTGRVQNQSSPEPKKLETSVMKFVEPEDEITFVNRMNSLTLMGGTNPMSRNLAKRDRFKTQANKRKRKKRSVGSLLMFGPWSRFYTALLLHRLVRNQSGMLYQAIVSELIRRYVIPSVGSTIFPAASSVLTQVTKQVLPGIAQTASMMHPTHPSVDMTPQSSFASNPLVALGSSSTPTRAESSSLGIGGIQMKLPQFDEPQKTNVGQPSSGSVHKLDDCQPAAQSPITPDTPRFEPDNQFSKTHVIHHDNRVLGDKGQASNILSHVLSPLSYSGSMLTTYPAYLQSMARLTQSGYTNLTKDVGIGASIYDRPPPQPSVLSQELPLHLMNAGKFGPEGLSALTNPPYGKNPFLPPNLQLNNLASLHSDRLPPEFGSQYRDPFGNKTTGQKIVDELVSNASDTQLVDLLKQMSLENKHQNGSSELKLSELKIEQLKSLSTLARLMDQTSRESNESSSSANSMADKILANTFELGLNNLISTLSNGSSATTLQSSDLVKNTSDLLVNSFGTMLKGLSFNEKGGKKERPSGPPMNDLSQSSEAPKSPVQINLSGENAVHLIDRLVAIARKSYLPPFPEYSTNHGDANLGLRESLLRFPSSDQTYTDEVGLSNERGALDEVSIHGSQHLSDAIELAPDLADDSETSQQDDLSSSLGLSSVKVEQKHPMTPMKAVNAYRGTKNLRATGRSLHHTASRSKKSEISSEMRASRKKSTPVIRTRAQAFQIRPSKRTKPISSSKLGKGRNGKESVSIMKPNLDRSNITKLRLTSTNGNGEKAIERSAQTSVSENQQSAVLSSSSGSISGHESELEEDRNGRIPLMSLHEDRNGSQQMAAQSPSISTSLRLSGNQATKYPQKHSLGRNRMASGESRVMERRKMVALLRPTGTGEAQLDGETSSSRLLASEIEDEINNKTAAMGSNSDKSSDQSNLNNLAMALNVMNMVLLNQKLASHSRESNGTILLTNASELVAPSSLRQMSSKQMMQSDVSMAQKSANEDREGGKVRSRTKLDGPTSDDQLPYRVYLSSNEGSDLKSGMSPRPSDVSVIRPGRLGLEDELESGGKTQEKSAENHRMEGNKIRISSSLLVAPSERPSAHPVGSDLYAFQPLGSSNLTSAADPSGHERDKSMAAVKPNSSEVVEPDYAARWNDVLQHLTVRTR